MLSINGKSYVLGHVMTLQIFGTLKSCTFGEIIKKCLINLILCIGLSWDSHVKRLCKVITCGSDYENEYY